MLLSNATLMRSSKVSERETCKRATTEGRSVLVQILLAERNLYAIRDASMGLRY